MAIIIDDNIGTEVRSRHTNMISQSVLTELDNRYKNNAEVQLAGMMIHSVPMRGDPFHDITEKNDPLSIVRIPTDPPPRSRREAHPVTFIDSLNAHTQVVHSVFGHLVISSSDPSR